MICDLKELSIGLLVLGIKYKEEKICYNIIEGAIRLDGIYKCQIYNYERFKMNRLIEGWMRMGT